LRALGRTRSARGGRLKLKSIDELKRMDGTEVEISGIYGSLVEKKQVLDWLEKS
jgi:hypothetical protein